MTHQHPAVGQSDGDLGPFRCAVSLMARSLVPQSTPFLADASLTPQGRLILRGRSECLSGLARAPGARPIVRVPIHRCGPPPGPTPARGSTRKEGRRPDPCPPNCVPGATRLTGPVPADRRPCHVDMSAALVSLRTSARSTSMPASLSRRTRKEPVLYQSQNPWTTDAIWPTAPSMARASIGPPSSVDAAAAATSASWTVPIVVAIERACREASSSTPSVS